MSSIFRVVNVSFTFFLLLVVLLILTCSYSLQTNLRSSSKQIMMSLQGQTSFLIESKDDKYRLYCLRKSIDACNSLLKTNEKLIEVEFPISRKSDFSVSQTLDENKKFVREFVKTWSSLGKDLCVLFPDDKERRLATSSSQWGNNLPFFVTSIEEMLKIKDDYSPKLLIAINPGFNVNEWIDLTTIYSKRNVPMIVFNGNLDRLRSGYYPKIFYPKLAKVTEQYYNKAAQAFFLSPVAVGGSRFGAWIAKVHPGKWELLVLNSSGQNYDVILQADEPFNPLNAWRIAKTEFTKNSGGNSIF